MLHFSRDLPDHGIRAGVLQGVMMQDLLCGAAHDTVHGRTPPDQVANEVHGPNCGYAAGHRHYNRLSRQGMAH